MEGDRVEAERGCPKKKVDVHARGKPEREAEEKRREEKGREGKSKKLSPSHPETTQRKRDEHIA
jgi:hypothetical protein